MQIDSDDAISKLHEYAEMVSGIPHTHQLLVLNNKPLQSSGSIGAAQVADGDMILVVQRTPEQRQQMQQQQQQVSAPCPRIHTDCILPFEPYLLPV